MAEWRIEQLDARHDRSAFSCGQSTLDDFIRLYAGQYQRKGVGRTYVAVPPGQMRVDGYYTLAAGSLALSILPTEASKKLPRHPVPVAHLGRLAVDLSVRGKGLGGVLLHDALTRCVQLSEQLALFAIEVYALDQDACRFYVKYGFAPLLDDPLHLYLPTKSVAPLLPGEDRKDGE